MEITHKGTNKFLVIDRGTHLGPTGEHTIDGRFGARLAHANSLNHYGRETYTKENLILILCCAGRRRFR